MLRSVFKLGRYESNLPSLEYLGWVQGHILSYFGRFSLFCFKKSPVNIALHATASSNATSDDEEVCSRNETSPDGRAHESFFLPLGGSHKSFFLPVGESHESFCFLPVGGAHEGEHLLTGYCVVAGHHLTRF